MIRSLYILAVAIAASGVAGGASADPDVAAAQQRWHEALRTRDAAALEALTSGEFRSVGISNWRQPLERRAYIDNALQKYELRNISIADQAIWRHGDAAEVRMVVTYDATYDGQDASGSYSILDLWSRREGAWRIVSHTVGPAPKAPR